jgi:hypothetical protein
MPSGQSSVSIVKKLKTAIVEVWNLSFLSQCTCPNFQLVHFHATIVSYVLVSRDSLVITQEDEKFYKSERRSVCELDGSLEVLFVHFVQQRSFMIAVNEEVHEDSSLGLEASISME